MPVEDRLMVSVLGLPASSRCRAILMWPILETARRPILMLQPEGTWEKVKESYHPAFKPGIAVILPGLHAAEEGFEGPVHSHRHVLENLGMDRGQSRPGFLDEGQEIVLLPITQRGFLNFTGILALGQQAVIETPALPQDGLKTGGLLLGG